MSDDTKQRSKEWKAGAEMMRRFVMYEMAKALKTVEYRRDRVATELAEMSGDPGKKEFTAKAAEYAAIKYEHFNVKNQLEGFQRWDSMRSCFDAFQSNTPEAE